MPTTRNPYPTEFREHIVARARSGRSVEGLAREFGPFAATIHLWLSQTKVDIGENDDGVTSAEREELKRLRRENRVLRQERNILSKSAAWFARNEHMSCRGIEFKLIFANASEIVVCRLETP